MAWGKISSVTGTGSGTNLTTGTITASKFNEFNIYTTAFVSGKLRFNNDTGSNYARRYSGNGNSDVSTNINLGYIASLWDLAPAFIHGYILNISDEEKLIMLWTTEANNTTGAGTAPNRMEITAKWVNTSDAITEIDIDKTGTNFTTDENFTVLGSDLTPSAGKPTNVQVGSRWEETDTRKMYHYTAPQAATDDIFSTGTGWSGDTSTYPYNSTINGIGCDTSTLGEAVTKTVTTLSASGQWVLRFKVTRETGDLGDGVMINLGSSSASTSSLARMQNGNGLYPYGIHLIYFANSNNVYAGGSHDGSFAWDFQSNANVTWSAGDTRWVEVSHASSTAYTTKVYSNANFTGTAVLTSVASPSSQTLNYDDITIGTKWSSNRKHIDFEDMQIWNGVTTAPASDNTWEEEGT